MEPSTYATYEKINCIKQSIMSLQVKDKRCLFSIMRLTKNLTSNSFFPRYGITAGQFSVFYVLSENNRKSKPKI